MAAGYIVFSVKVTNQEQYDAYRQLSTEAQRVHGAEPLVRGGEVQILEGDWDPGRTVILKFPSVAAAKAFYDSPEYLKAREAREGASITRAVLIEGV